MRVKHHYHSFRRKLRLCKIQAGILAIIACLFLFPSYVKYEKTGNNYYTVTLNGTDVGTVAKEELANKYLIEARKRIASQKDDLLLINANLKIVGEEKSFGKISSSKSIINNMEKVLRNSIKETLHHAYTVKINETTVNLESYDDVYNLLKEALGIYDPQHLFDVNIILDPTREVNALVPQVVRREEKIAKKNATKKNAGVAEDIENMLDEAVDIDIRDFDDYEEGLVDISFADSIEIVEAYLIESEICPLSEAIDSLTKEQETQVVYKVESGDTLSGIALKNDIPLENLIAINDALEDENTTIRVGQELLITVPEPELSISWKEEKVYIEEYDAEVQYVLNDSWYTTQRKTLQEPSAGVRQVVAVTEYKNGKSVGREILKEEVYADSIPKIVEKGTKIPPTYVKPLQGGRISSKFGPRKAPTKGASTYHKGIDWSTPVGTSVFASNGGTVVTAGWVSGYGYAVYINHSDGRQTRYGHLSKVLVKSGQVVSQGEKIALSGNTGRSTGPHLHFEIRIGGNAVDPLKYLN